MKNSSFPILLPILFLLTSLAAQGQKQEYALKLGGSYYIKCQRTIVYQEMDIMFLSDIENKGNKVNFDIYSPIGQLDAKVNSGKLEGIYASSFAVVASQDEFTVVDRRDGRTVCHIEKKWNLKQERWDLLVWADLYLPDGNRFQCTPETTNVPTINMLSGATFSNNMIAIQIN